MNKLVDLIKKELSWSQDMRNVDKALAPLPDIESHYFFRDIGKIVAWRVYHFYKPIVRGGGLGALAGVAYGFFIGDNVPEGAAYGAVVLGSIDCAQFYPRMAYHWVKSFGKKK